MFMQSACRPECMNECCGRSCESVSKHTYARVHASWGCESLFACTSHVYLNISVCLCGHVSTCVCKVICVCAGGPRRKPCKPHLLWLIPEALTAHRAKLWLAPCGGSEQSFTLLGHSAYIGIFFPVLRVLSAGSKAAEPPPPPGLPFAAEGIAELVGCGRKLGISRGTKGALEGY